MKDPIGKIISSIHRHQHMYISRNLQKTTKDIGPGQVYVFMIIGLNEGLYQKDIARELILEKATVAKAVKKLTENGYAITEEDPDDKRHTRVFLTDKGRKILPSIRTFFHEVNQFLLKGFTEDEIEKFNGMLQEMNDNLLSELSNSRKG